MNFEISFTNICENLVAATIGKTIDFFIIENKDRIKKRIRELLVLELLIDISNIWKKKSQCIIARGNTPFTWTGNGFGDHC